MLPKQRFGEADEERSRRASSSRAVGGFAVLARGGRPGCDAHFALPRVWWHARGMKYEPRLLVLLGGMGFVAAGCHGADALMPQTTRCGPTPRLLVSAASYWPADAGAPVASIVGMALDGSDLYFSVVLPPAAAVPQGALMHVSTNTGAVTQLADGYEFQTPIVTPTSVIVGVIAPSTYLGGILSVPRNGGAATPVATFNDGLLRYLPPVTDGTTVYFVDSAGVQSVPLTIGAAPASPTQVASGHPSGLLVSGQRLLLLTEGTFMQIPIGSGDAGGESLLAVAPPGELPGSLIPCGANACWLTNDTLGDDTVLQIDPTSGVISTLASVSGGPAADADLFAFDGTNFFVLGTSAGSAAAAIERISPPGGAPVIVANLPSFYDAGPFAVDDACVYFSTPAGIYSLSSSAESVSVQ